MTGRGAMPCVYGVISQCSSTISASSRHRLHMTDKFLTNEALPKTFIGTDKSLLECQLKVNKGVYRRINSYTTPKTSKTVISNKAKLFKLQLFRP